MRMTTFIIGIILAATIMTGFGLILADADTQYGADYDPNEMQTFQQLEEMTNLTNQIKNRVSNQSTDRSLADVVGGFIADGKDTLTLSAQSYQVFETMADEGMEKANVPNAFKVSLFAIMLIIIFLGIILAAVLGRNL